MKEIGAEVNVKKMRIKTDREEWGDMVVIGLGSEGEKKNVMEKKGRLKGKRIWIWIKDVDKVKLDMEGTEGKVESEK